MKETYYLVEEFDNTCGWESIGSKHSTIRLARTICRRLAKDYLAQCRIVKVTVIKEVVE